jgi:hypothetical protein
VKIDLLILFFAWSALLTPVDASRFSKSAKNDLRQFAVSGDGRSPRWCTLGESLQVCRRVSVMGAHKIGDEKKHTRRQDQVYCLNSSLRNRAGKDFHVIGSLASNLGRF